MLVLLALLAFAGCLPPAQPINIIDHQLKVVHYGTLLIIDVKELRKKNREKDKKILIR